MKAILATCGCVDQRLADLGAEAGDDVDHAGRKARLLDELANSSAEHEVNSDGLMTTVLPAASAGASFQAVSSSGEFHGVIARDDAERLVAREVEDVRLVDRDDRAFDLVGEAAVIVEPLRHDSASARASRP